MCAEKTKLYLYSVPLAAVDFRSPPVPVSPSCTFTLQWTVPSVQPNQRRAAVDLPPCPPCLLHSATVGHLCPPCLQPDQRRWTFRRVLPAYRLRRRWTFCVLPAYRRSPVSCVVAYCRPAAGPRGLANTCSAHPLPRCSRCCPRSRAPSLL